MDSKDFVIDRLAKEKAQLEVNIHELEFIIIALKQENKKLKKELEEPKTKTTKKKPTTTE